MDLNKMTERMQNAMIKGQEEAQKLSHQQLLDIHVLFILVNDQQSIVPTILERLSISNQLAIDALKKRLDQIPQVYQSANSNTSIYLSHTLHEILTKANDFLQPMNDSYLSVEHFMMASLKVKESFLYEFFEENHIETKQVEQIIMDIRGVVQ